MRNVRNFWLEAKIDGRKTVLASGPRGRDGGFELKIFQRVDGKAEHVCSVVGLTCENGELLLRITGDGPYPFYVGDYYNREGSKVSTLEFVSMR